MKQTKTKVMAEKTIFETLLSNAKFDIDYTHEKHYLEIADDDNFAFIRIECNIKHSYDEVAATYLQPSEIINLEFEIEIIELEFYLGDDPVDLIELHYEIAKKALYAYVGS